MFLCEKNFEIESPEIEILISLDSDLSLEIFRFKLESQNDVFQCITFVNRVTLLDHNAYI